MSADLAHIRQVMAEADCLFTEAEVEAAIDKVASQINAELAAVSYTHLDVYKRQCRCHCPPPALPPSCRPAACAG